MKYFTKEELEKIAEKILNNPTRETLKELNEEYNGKEELNIDTPKTIPNSIPNEKEAEPLPPVVDTPVASPLPNTDTKNFNIPETNNVSNNTSVFQSIPSFELPKVDSPASSNYVPNNSPIDFNGNLWEPSLPEVNNLMDTTDNFNVSNPSSQNVEVPVVNGPFFGQTNEPVNNPIPISGTPSQQGPTMFGQMQSNYGNAA